MINSSSTKKPTPKKPTLKPRDVEAAFNLKANCIKEIGHKLHKLILNIIFHDAKDPNVLLFVAKLKSELGIVAPHHGDNDVGILTSQLPEVIDYIRDNKNSEKKEFAFKTSTHAKKTPSNLTKKTVLTPNSKHSSNITNFFLPTSSSQVPSKQKCYSIVSNGCLTTRSKLSSDSVEMKVTSAEYKVTSIEHRRELYSGEGHDSLNHTYIISFRNTEQARLFYKEVFTCSEEYHGHAWESKDKCRVVTYDGSKQIRMARLPVFLAAFVILAANNYAPIDGLSEFRGRGLTALEDPKDIESGSKPGRLTKAGSGYYEMTSTLERQKSKTPSISY